MTSAQTHLPAPPKLRATDLVRFIERETHRTATILVPEVELHLARDAREIFVAAEALLDGARGSQPYWAFAWPGGQALARYIESWRTRGSLL
jgi:predicted nicotinamide N-methyase